MSTFFRDFINFLKFSKRSRRSNRKANYKTGYKTKYQSFGFTMIEVLVVMIIVGVLSAIAAPSWLGFVNTQRLNGSQTKVFQAIKSAQSEAKQRQTSNVNRVRLTLNTNANANAFKLDNVAIESGREQPLEKGVIISSITGNGANLGTPVPIEFDSRGFLYDPNKTLSLPICINLKLENTQKIKWIKIQTLLGAVTTGENTCP